MTTADPHYLDNRLNSTVFRAGFIPSHDTTHELAMQIGRALHAFHFYVAEVRDEAQANDALKELVDATWAGVYEMVGGIDWVWTHARVADDLRAKRARPTT